MFRKRGTRGEGGSLSSCHVKCCSGATGYSRNKSYSKSKGVLPNRLNACISRAGFCMAKIMVECSLVVIY